MATSGSEEPRTIDSLIADGAETFEDLLIQCSDCADEFTWTVGEQEFFRIKELQNPPKRCRPCKKAKNRRIEAVEKAKIEGKRSKIEVNAECARCGVISTVPFYPSQGRPVYCRECFATIKVERAAGANG